MKETRFIQQRQNDWDAWERWLNTTKRQSSRGKKNQAAAPASFRKNETDTAITVQTLPSAFRRLCQDLSLARDRNYSSSLIHSLHQRVLAAHQRIYGARPQLAGHWLSFLAGGLPRLVRDEKRLVLAAAALFFLPLILTLVLLQWHPDGIYFLMSPEAVEQYKTMYAPETHRADKRGAEGELRMLAFYIANNVRIDFQCFAGGIAFGLGSIFYLVFNGLVIGATAGYLTEIGYGETFWGFVAGHSAPELIGAVLSGAAGLKIGLSLVAPGRKRRLDALKESAQGAVRLLYGAAALTFSAAFIEAFWSPIRSLPLAVKVGAGIAVWLTLLCYFLFAGRGQHAD